MSDRYRVNWAPSHLGAIIAVYDVEDGLLVAGADRNRRAALDELVRLANLGAATEQAFIEKHSTGDTVDT